VRLRSGKVLKDPRKKAEQIQNSKQIQMTKWQMTKTPGDHQDALED
jgi:hypothetical protein